MATGTSFSKESCQFVLRNTASLEGGIVEAVQGTVFTAINARLEKRFKALGGWKGHYQLASGGTLCPAKAMSRVRLSVWYLPQDSRQMRSRACFCWQKAYLVSQDNIDSNAGRRDVWNLRK